MKQLFTRFIYIALIALSVASCRVAEKGEGYIYINLESVVGSNIDIEPATKAEVEASENYIVDIDGTLYTYGDIKSTPISLPIGEYKVQAYNCTQADAQEGNGKPRFASEIITIDIQVGQTHNLSLQCTMVNSRFTFAYDAAFETEFDTATSTLEVSNSYDFSGRVVTLSSLTDKVYFTSGESVFVRVSACKKGHNTPHTTRVVGPYIAQAATSHNITINYASPVLDLSAAASHTYDGANYLTGTTLKLSVGSFSGINSEKFASWGIDVMDGNGNLIHTYTSSTIPSAGATINISKYNGANYNNWIYLPQGTTCTLGTPYVVLITGEKVYCTNSSPTISATVPSPNFSVAVQAETSYSRYLAGSSSANNSGTGDQIMNIGAKVTISNDVLAQIKPTMVFTYDGLSMLTGSTIQTNTVAPQTLENNESLLSGSNIVSQAWGTHTIAASVTFDNVTKSSNLPCHVTGIPYEVSLNKNTSGWTNFSNVETDSGYFIFNPDDAHVLSPAFHIPSSVNVTVTLDVYAYHTNATAKYEPTVYVKASSTPVKLGESASISSSISLVGVAGCKSKDFNVQMTSSAKNISLYVYGKENKGWLSGADYPEFFMNKFVLKYRW